MCHQYIWIDTPKAYGRTTLTFRILMGWVKKKFSRGKIKTAKLSKKIFLHPVISYLTIVISTCSFVSHDYVPPLLMAPEHHRVQ